MLFMNIFDLLNRKPKIKFKLESETSSVKIEDCCELQYNKLL